MIDDFLCSEIPGGIFTEAFREFSEKLNSTDPPGNEDIVEGNDQNLSQEEIHTVSPENRQSIKWEVYHLSGPGFGNNGMDLETIVGTRGLSLVTFLLHIRATIFISLYKDINYYISNTLIATIFHLFHHSPSSVQDLLRSTSRNIRAVLRLVTGLWRTVCPGY